MAPFLLYLFKFSISLSAVYLLYVLLLRRLTFYQWNRWYLMVYPVLGFFLPSLNISWWMDENQVSPALLELLPALGSWKPSGREVQANGIDWWDWGTRVFFAGILLMLVRVLVQYISLLRMQKRAKLLADGSVKLYEVKDPIIPFSFGSAVYINPTQHSEADLKEIIRHEMVHVRQHHTIDIILSELLVVINWFNPFAWFIRKAIRQNLEFIADRQVLEHGLDRRQYQYLLLKVVGQQQFTLGSHLNFSALKTRITMMNKIRSARVHLVKFAFALPLAAVLLLAFRKQQDPVSAVTPDSSYAPGDIQLNKLADFAMPGSNVKPVTDTVPGKKNFSYTFGPTEKDYYLTISGGNGETIVTVKDKTGKLIKSVPIGEWEKNAGDYEKLYGKLPPPPPPPPAPPAPPAHLGQPSHPAPPAPPAAPAPLPADAIYIVDGKESTIAEVNLIAPGQIQTMNVFKSDAAISKYGDKARNGVVEIRTSDATAPKNQPGNGVTPNTIWVVDGKIVAREEALAYKKEEISSVNILKGESAVLRYGEKAKDGVVEISLLKVN